MNIHHLSTKPSILNKFISEIRDQKIQKDSGANIDIDAKTNKVCVHSTDKNALKKAKDIIENYIKIENDKNFICNLYVPSNATSTLIGSKGSQAMFIQNE